MGLSHNSKDGFLPHIEEDRRRLVYENMYQQVHQVEAVVAGFKKEYFVTYTGHRAGIVVEREGSVLLVKQYRLIINGLSWEIPGGKVDDGESPGTAAVRECLEETGVRCLSPRPLISYHPGLDTLFCPTHIFHCDQISEESETHNVHLHEVSGCEWISVSRCIDMISNGDITDAFSIIGLLAYQAQMGRE